MDRLGMTIPFLDIPLVEQREWVKELADRGWTDVWSAEADGYDAFTPLALASAWAPELRLGTAIVPAFTRSPALMAQSVATMAAAAPGRFVFGIGTSSDVIVERWNGIPFEEPYRQVRDMVRFVGDAMGGDKVSATVGNRDVNGFRLGVKVAEPPKVMVAALRPGMLRLAGRESDGAIINWLSADDVRTVAPVVHEAAPEGAEREVVARIFVMPDADRATVLWLGRRMIASYLNVPVYRAFHEWLGRTEELAEMWRLWGEGDRAGATDAIPEKVVDELIVSGPAEACREHVERYRANGVTTPCVALLAAGEDQRTAFRALSPQ